MDTTDLPEDWAVQVSRAYAVFDVDPLLGGFPRHITLPYRNWLSVKTE